ncbi:MAG: hypothetical protein QM667_12960 [Asticcacaulis sp.]
MQHLLDRQNQIALEILGEDEPCWMTCYYDDLARIKPHPEWGWGISDRINQHAKRRFNMKCVQTFYDSDDFIFWIYAAPTVWRQNRFDSLQRHIARDYVKMMWVSRRTGAIFAPYEGGLDLILPDLAQKEHLRQTYANWLAPPSSEHKAQPPLGRIMRFDIMT